MFSSKNKFYMVFVDPLQWLSSFIFFHSYYSVKLFLFFFKTKEGYVRWRLLTRNSFALADWTSPIPIVIFSSPSLRSVYTTRVYDSCIRAQIFSSSAYLLSRCCCKTLHESSHTVQRGSLLGHETWCACSERLEESRSNCETERESVWERSQREAHRRDATTPRTRDRFGFALVNII